MSKRKKPYNVKSNVIEDILWDDLNQLNSEINSTVITLGNKFVELVETIKKDVEDDITIFKIIDGVSNSIVDVRNTLNKLGKLHSKEIDGVPHLFTGVVKIDDDKHSKLYMNLLTAYSSLGQDLNNLSNTGIATVMTRYEEIMSVKKGK